MTTWHIISKEQGIELEPELPLVGGLREVKPNSVATVEINNGVLDKIELEEGFFSKLSQENYVVAIISLKNKLKETIPNLNMNNTQVLAPYHKNNLAHQVNRIDLSPKGGGSSHAVYKANNRLMQSLPLSEIRTPEEQKEFITKQRKAIFNKAHDNLRKDKNSAINQLYKFKDNLLSIIGYKSKGFRHVSPKVSTIVSNDLELQSNTSNGVLGSLTEQRKCLREQLEDVLNDSTIGDEKKLKQVINIQEKNNALSKKYGKKDNSGRLGRELVDLIESMKQYDEKADKETTTTPGI